MSNIIESANIDDIALYLQREDGLDAEAAHAEAKQVLMGFNDMMAKGLIKGWYFNEQGHLELLPTDSAMQVITHSK